MPPGSHKWKGGNKGHKGNDGNEGHKGNKEKGKGKGKATISKEEFTKEKFEKVLYTHYGRQPVYSVQKVIFLNGFREDPQYESSVHIGNIECFTPGVASCEDDALDGAMRKCYDAWRYGPKKNTGPKLTVSKTADILNTHEWAKSLSNETIAGLFRDVLRHYAFLDNVKREEYTTRVCHKGTLVGYTSQVNFKDEIFHSLGLMTSEDQAKQSAAEICLRTLGYLPDVKSAKNLTIQPYQGGFISKVAGTASSKPYLFTSRLSSQLLEAFVESRSLMEHPRYYVIVSEDGGDAADQVMDCICCVDGKVFEASTSQPKHVALQLAADKAVSYFGITHPHERMQLCKHVHLLRYDFYDIENLTSLRKPNLNKGWLWNCFVCDNSHEECEISKTVKDLVASPIFLGNLPMVDYQNELIEAEIRRKPSFEGSPLASLNNICVAAIDPANRNLVTIGNSEFSIKMWCTDGKIYSKQKKCAIDIVPGHFIQQLTCEYRAFVPSLEVYLHAVDCNVLSHADPPKPVVASCGVIVLTSDDSTGVNNVCVLLQRRIDYTKRKGAPIELIKALLRKLKYEVETDVTVAKVMEGVQEWEKDDVKLLSVMSVHSLRQLISKYEKFKAQWNELLKRPEIPKELQEIKDICLNELKRRHEEEEEELSKENIDSMHQQWELPQTEFMSRFGETGIHIEGSKLCAMRSLAEMTGVKISLADVEKCSIINVPVDEDGKQQCVSRYYIWNKIGETLVSETKVVKELPGGYKFFKEGKALKHNSTRYVWEQNEVRMDRYLRNIQYVNTDGAKVSPWNTPFMALPSNSSNVASNGNRIVCLPGDKSFVSYMKSLKFAFKSLGIESPMLLMKTSEDSTSKYKTIEFTFENKKYFFKSQPILNSEEAEDEIAKKVLKALGFIPDESDTIGITSKEESVCDDDGDKELYKAQEEHGDNDATMETMEHDYRDENEDDIRLSSKDESSGETKLEEDAQEKDDDEEMDDHTGEADKEEHSGGKRPILSSLPPRDAFCLQCQWMVLDKAIEACPMLKKISVTSQFQDLVQQQDTK